MRQGQQNRRGRGRNRKGQNPMTRSFESNGPDVKIRGTPTHIAEKYISLARDASASGDPVLAENYLQHAEHYNRIIMAFREQQIGQGGDAMNGGMGRHRMPQLAEPVDSGDDFGEDEGDDLAFDMQSGPSPMRQYEPQPQPRFNDAQPQRYDDRPQRYEDRPQRHEQHRHRDRDRQGGEQQRGFSPERQPQSGGSRGDQPAEAQASGQPPRQEGQQRRRERFVPSNEQPEFLRRPVRRPRRESSGNGPQNEAASAEPATTVEDSGRD